MRCGIHNDQIDNMLLQCGKCKKAYYCSMACFNADLSNHQKFCNTGSLQRTKSIDSTTSTTSTASSSSTPLKGLTRKASISSKDKKVASNPQLGLGQKLNRITEESKQTLHQRPSSRSFDSRSIDTSLDGEKSLYCSDDSEC
jgi:MYND finger